MYNRPILIALLFLLPVALTAGAQEVSQLSQEAESNPIQKIVEESEGTVVIEMPDYILELILTPPEENVKQGPTIRTGVNKISGYRIQVFSDGRNQHSLESRAKARGNAILAKFPKYRGQIYTFSKSPNWYTRVGNFQTAQEAADALAELKRAFPSFAAEMRTVKCQIVVVKP